MSTSLSSVCELTEAELLDEWECVGRSAGWSPATVEARRYALLALARDTGAPLQDLTTLQVARWLGRFTTPATLLTYHSHARSFFRWLQHSGHRADDPTAALPRPRKPRGAPRPVTTRQLEDALDGAGWNAFAYITIAAYSGLRVSEVAKIKGEDLDLVAGTLRVNGKGGHEAVLPLHDRIAKLAKHYPRKGYWFPSRTRAGHVEGNWVGQVIRGAFAHAGHQMTAHQLRHWYGTQVLRASGGNLLVAQQLLRHASPATTAIYCQIEDSARTAAIEALP
jgi:integrase/recombinase XerD